MKKTDFAQERIKEKNIKIHWNNSILLYNKANYEEALLEFERLIEYDGKLKIVLAPLIERCQQIKNIERKTPEATHFSNQQFLGKYQWLYYGKYLTGFLAMIFIAMLIYNMKSMTRSFLVTIGGAFPYNSNTFTNRFSLPYFFIALVFAVATIVIYLKMRKYTSSKGLFRCKYCGQYIKRINSNLPGFVNNKLNHCYFCGRTNPATNFYWDSWEGLEYLNQQRMMPELEFYQEFEFLKEKYKKEYDAWRLNGWKLSINE